MGGIRIGGVSVIVTCSPPFTAYHASPLGPPNTTSTEVWVWCSTNAPGEATAYTNFNGFVESDQNSNPVVSPDGTKVLFDLVSADTGYTEIWVVDAVAGSTPTQLVADPNEYVFEPAWGADSDTFVYVKGATGNTVGGAIYKDQVSAIGSPVALKSAAGGFSPFRPQFNFDGTRVAYVWAKDLPSGSASDGDLRCMDDDGTNDASLDNAIGAYFSAQPTQFSWANTQNLIAYVNVFPTPDTAWVIDDAGAGKTQLNAFGDGSGFNAVISRYAWPADDSFVVYTANMGTGHYVVLRAELDGSNTTVLGTTGAVVQGWYSGALVYGGRIWFISATDASESRGVISSMLLDGTDEREDFDSSDGSGDMVYPFTGGDGWYVN